MLRLYGSNVQVILLIEDFVSRIGPQLTKLDQTRLLRQLAAENFRCHSEDMNNFIGDFAFVAWTMDVLYQLFHRLDVKTCRHEIVEAVLLDFVHFAADLFSTPLVIGLELLPLII